MKVSGFIPFSNSGAFITALDTIKVNSTRRDVFVLLLLLMWFDLCVNFCA